MNLRLQRKSMVSKYVRRTPVRDSVETAATALDHVFPEWETKIDFDAVDMNTYDRCVLGQIAGIQNATAWTHAIAALWERGYDRCGAFSDERALPYWRDQVQARLMRKEQQATCKRDE